MQSTLAPSLWTSASLLQAGQRRGRLPKTSASAEPKTSRQSTHAETTTRDVEETMRGTAAASLGGVGIGRRQLLAAQCATSALAFSQLDAAKAVELTETELLQVIDMGF